MAERLAIFRYTDADFHSMNYVLHHNFPTPGNKSYSSDIFLKIMFMASGLNKISPNGHVSLKVQSQMLIPIVARAM